MEGVLSNSGYGYGYGYGSGYGSGDGDGSGYGSGYGYGQKLARVGEHEVEVIREFGVVKVGCQVHTISEWRRRWKQIASDHEVNVTQAEVDGLLSLAEAR